MTQKYIRREVRLQVLDKKTGVGKSWEPPLTINADITRDDRLAPNKASVTIYNLRRESRAFIRADNRILRLFAGYQGNESLLYQGDIFKVKEDRRNTADGSSDEPLKIKCGDGQDAFQNATINKSLSGEVSVKGMVKEAGKQLGDLVNISDDVEDKKQTQGASLIGSARDVLTDKVESLGANASIQSGTVEVTTSEGPKNEPAFLLSSDSGLVGFPKQKKDGVEVTAFLTPQATPRRIFKLSSKLNKYNGFYMIVSLRHKIRWKEKPFYTIITGKPLEDVEI